MTLILEYDNPEIINKKGKNWDNFKSVINSELQFLLKKVYSIQDINNVSTMQDEIINYELNINDIPIIIDSINAKRAARRKYVSNFKYKGNPDVYLDIQEAIVGIRGSIFTGDEVAGFTWDETTWPEGLEYQEDSHTWPGNKPFLEIWVNVKTNDTILINRILEIYRTRTYRPAFFQIYLTDDTLQILGVV